MQNLRTYIDPALPDLNGSTFTRQAVRGLLRQGSQVLLLHVPSLGTYKIPGGGVEAGETDLQALARELEEECSLRLLEVTAEVGETLEYFPAQEAEVDIFCMACRFYVCRAEPLHQPLQLSTSEQELKLTPVWVALEQALEANRQQIPRLTGLRWLARDVVVLEHFLQNF